MRVIIELWLNGTFRGYRTVSQPMFEKLQQSGNGAKKGQKGHTLLSNVDVEVFLVKKEGESANA